MSCPVGTNVLRRKYFIQNSDAKTDDIPEQWTLATQGIISHSFCVKACSHYPFEVGPYETVRVHSIARDLNSNTSSVITESSVENLGYVVCPRVIEINSNSSVIIPV